MSIRPYEPYSRSPARINGGLHQARHYREKPMTDYEPLAALSDIHAKRGYLLSHHGLMAISAPHLLERYDSLYSTLALK